MPVYLAAYSPEGRLLARCCGSCCAAKGPRCKCLCDGANHGVAKEAAEAQTDLHIEEWMDAYIVQHGFAHFRRGREWLNGAPGSRPDLAAVV